jgi:hypothetical protein
MFSLYHSSPERYLLRNQQLTTNLATSRQNAEICTSMQ